MPTKNSKYHGAPITSRTKEKSQMKSIILAIGPVFALTLDAAWPSAEEMALYKARREVALGTDPLDEDTDRDGLRVANLERSPVPWYGTLCDKIYRELSTNE